MMEGVGANDHGIGDMERSTLTDDSSQQHRDLSPGQHGKPPENGYLQQLRTKLDKQKYKVAYLETMRQLAFAKQLPVSSKNLATAIEVFPDVPVYIKIPVKELIAPMTISFSYFNIDDEVINPKTVKLKVFASATEKDPYRHYKNYWEEQKLADPEQR